MQDDPFLLLGIKPSLALDPEHLEARYREASRTCHPDTPDGDAEAFAALGTARATLANPNTRIPAALAALGLSGPPTNPSAQRSAPMSGALMDLFALLSPQVQEVEEMARKKTAARSELARALLANEEIAARRPLEATGERLRTLAADHLSRLGELDQAIAVASDAGSALPPGELPTVVREALQIAHDCAFLEKWQAQVRETLMKLFV